MSDTLQEPTIPDDPAPSPATTLPPGVAMALRQGWQAMKSHFLLYFLAVLVLAAFLIPFNIYDEGERGRDSGLLALIETAYMLLLYPVIQYGADLLFLRGVRGDEVKVNSLFDGFRTYVNVVLAALLVLGLVGIGLVVFLIPGLYVACRLVFVGYLVMDEGLDPIAAVEASWRLTRGHALKIFLLGLVSIFVFFGGLMLLLVGAFPATMWIKASFASLYLAITNQTGGVPPAAPSPPSPLHDSVPAGSD
jgi:uncharacterized membrane protein